MDSSGSRGETMVIYFDIAAAIITLTLIGALITRNLVKGRTNMLFLVLSLAVMLTSILDAVCDMYGVYFESNIYNVKLQSFYSYVYFVLRNLTAPLYVLYISSLLGIWHKVINKKSLYFYLIFVPYLIDLIMLCINLFTKFVFYYDENCTYQRNNGMFVLYFIAFYYLIFSTYMLIKYKNLIHRNQYIVLLGFLPFNAGAVMMQMLFSSLRIEMLATSFMAIVIAIAIQRPEELIDNVVNAQSYSAFLMEVGKYFRAERRMSVLMVKFTNHMILRNSIGLDVYLLLLRNIAGKLTRIAKVMNLHSDIFYMDHGTFCIVTDESNEDILLDMGRITCAYMQEPIKLNQLEVMLDAKICQACCPDDLPDLETLLNFVSTFEEKIPDTGRVVVFEKAAESKDFRLKSNMGQIINKAIATNEFKMYYQPIYSTKEHKFVSAEALIRLIDDTYGFVSPGLFIPAAEESGAIHQIGDFVLEDVFRFISETDFEALGLKYIELNLSVAQCVETDLAEKIEELMKRYGVKPEQINLEITETAVDYDPATTDANISKLSALGIPFSLDDYGTGYSNIKRVVSLPFNIVKLDKSLVDEMDNPMMWTVIRNTVSMLQKMKKHILVEGIEEQRAVDRFSEIGCDYIQGYFYSKPLPEDKFLEFVKTANCE